MDRNIRSVHFVRCFFFYHHFLPRRKPIIKLNTWFYETNATGKNAGADMTASPDQGSEAVAASGRQGEKHRFYELWKELIMKNTFTYCLTRNTSRLYVNRFDAYDRESMVSYSVLIRFIKRQYNCWLCCQFVVKMLSKPQMSAKLSPFKRTQSTKKARFLGLF